MRIFTVVFYLYSYKKDKSVILLFALGIFFSSIIPALILLSILKK